MKRIKKRLKKQLKRLGYPLTAWVIMLLGRAAMKMRRETALKTARLAGDLVYGVLRIRRGLVEKNLRHSLPDKDSKEIDRIARQVYRNQVLNLVEMLRIPLIRDRRDAQDIIETRTDESFQALLEKRTGAVVVTAHLSSWEVIGVCMGLLFMPVNFIVKPLKNRRLDQYLNSLRTLRGNRVIYKDKALRQGLSVLKNNGVLVVLGDQSNRKGDYYTDFLGRKSTIFLGPAFWALKSGKPLFVETSRRLEDNKYLVELTEVPSSDLSYNKEDFRTLAGRYTRILEEFIRKHPEEWLWLHDRWKRSPPSL